MRNKLATYALVGALGLTAVAGAALAAPAVSYAATGDSAALDSRVSSLKDALAGLVSDGTLTQKQADRVASTLAESRPEGLGQHGRGGGRGVHLEALSSLGITAEEVRAAAAAGTTLGQLAAEQDVSRDEVVSALVAAGKKRFADAVAAGRLTQAEADEKSAELQARITEKLDDPIRQKGSHRGRPGGPHADDEKRSSSSPTQAPTDSPDA